MTRNRFKWSAIAAAFVTASLAGSVALAAQTEVECNNPAIDDMGAVAINPATGNSYIQPLSPDGSGVATLNGTILNSAVNPCGALSMWRDLDFYSFQAKANKDLSLVISRIYETNKTVANLALFGPDSYGHPRALLSQMYFNSVPGTNTSFWDAAFNFSTTRDGTYYVAVSSYPTYFIGDMGHVALLNSYYYPNSAQYPTVGYYTLTVSGVESSVMTIGIDIKPGNNNVTVVDASGNRQSAGFRGNAQGSIPVALLSGKDFKPMDVDQSSLRFGKTGQEETLVSCNGGHGKDLNGDGVPDLVCHFDLSHAGFDLIDNQAVLTGKTSDGADFKGTGWMKIMTTGLRPEDLVRGAHKK